MICEIGEKESNKRFFFHKQTKTFVRNRGIRGKVKALLRSNVVTSGDISPQ